MRVSIKRVTKILATAVHPEVKRSANVTFHLNSNGTVESVWHIYNLPGKQYQDWSGTPRATWLTQFDAWVKRCHLRML